jgi:hypothetical protein
MSLQLALKSHASVDHQHGPELKEQETTDRGSIAHRIRAGGDPNVCSYSPDGGSLTLIVDHRQSIETSCGMVEKRSNGWRHMSSAWYDQVDRPRRWLEFTQESHEGARGKIVCNLIRQRTPDSTPRPHCEKHAFNFRYHQLWHKPHSSVAPRYAKPPFGCDWPM